MIARGRPLVALVLVLGGGGLSGCAGGAQARLAEARRTSTLARERGAYRCAPEALARAEAHADFAKLELAAGEIMRAEAQLDLAERNAAKALKDAQACLAVAPIPEPPRPVEKEPEIPAPPAPVEEPAPPPEAPPDRDGDGVPDAEDKCPDEPGVPEEAGCPAPKLIVVQKDKIELKQKIHFATNAAKILPDSAPLLGEIATALKQRPSVRVRIEGHTDSRGSPKLNTRLSRARAEAVRAWLVAAGVEAARLSAVGYGPAQPIADNRTAAGREENRRVEFFLLTE